MEETNLKDEVRELNKNIQQFIEQNQRKKFKLPFSGKISAKDAREGYATIVYINENREVSFTKAQIKEGVIRIDGCPRIATTDCMLSYKGKPMIIQPSWSIEPFSPSASYKGTVDSKNTDTGYRLLLNNIEQAEIKPKKKISGKLIFGIIIALIVVAYLIFGR